MRCGWTAWTRFPPPTSTRSRRRACTARPCPREAGGLGLDLRAICAVAEELASGCLATAFVWIQHRGLVMTLAADGTPAALRDRWLGSICQGKVRGGIALTGLIPGPPLLRAQPAAGGWRLDGEAPWVTGWGLIDLLLVQARGPQDSVVTLILDAAAQPGLTVPASGSPPSTRASPSGSASTASWFPRSASPARCLSTRRRASVQTGCASTGRSRWAWSAGALGCSVPAARRRAGRLPGAARRRDHRRCRPRWPQARAAAWSWPSGPRRRWRCGTEASRSPWTSTRSGSPARRCSLLVFGSAGDQERAAAPARRGS